MARTRSSKSSTKDLKNRRLEGPTCIGPLTKERLAAKHPAPQVPLPVMKTPARRDPGLSTCVQTTYTLNKYLLLNEDILPLPDVSNVDDLEPAVRAITSPSGNFIWGHTKIVKTSDPSPSAVADILQIILIHNNHNHNGNVHYKTVAMFQPTSWEPRNLLLEEQEVIGIDQILSNIRGWKNKVQSCTILHAHVREQSIMARGPAFPNGMGNEKRYPPPWDKETWDKRIEERERKKMVYKARHAKKRPRDRPRGLIDSGNHSRRDRFLGNQGQIPGNLRGSGATTFATVPPPSDSARLNSAVLAFERVNDVPRSMSRSNADSRMGCPTQNTDEDISKDSTIPEKSDKRETPLPPSRTPNPSERPKEISRATGLELYENDYDLDSDRARATDSAFRENPGARKTKNSMRAGIPTLATGRDYPKANSRMDPGCAFFLGASSSERFKPADDDTVNEESGDRESSDGSRRTKRRRQ
ncbi:hypothetical protein N0V82_001086 [Gnomoniopsis sp. IMI 355080]|nr:hypothetical protein N0V82_001086 [Gnomoniopsis sp. IMI 355080]